MHNFTAIIEQEAQKQERRKAILEKLKIVDGATMLTTHYEEPRFIWKDILPDAGLCVCAASKATGKTLYLLQLANAIAKGEPFLGVSTTKSNVLFLELELSQRRTAQRLSKMGIVPSADLSFAFAWEQGDPGLEALEVFIEEKRVKLVVVDVLQMLWPMNADANSYQDTYSVLSPLRQMANRLGCMIILVTHRRKAETADYIDSVIGSTGIAANADVVLTLARNRGENTAVLSIDGNDIESAKLALQFNVDPLGFTKSDADPMEAQQGRERREILEIMRKLGGTATTGQIAERYGRAGSTVSELMRKLADQGLVASVGYGKWSLLHNTETTETTESSNVETDSSLGTLGTFGAVSSVEPENELVIY